MRVLKDAGIPCGILVAKHADGFCNWPTAYSDYSVKNATWKDGKLAVILESGAGQIVLNAVIVEGKFSGDYDFAGQSSGKWVAVRKK